MDNCLRGGVGVSNYFFQIIGVEGWTKELVLSKGCLKFKHVGGGSWCLKSFSKKKLDPKTWQYIPFGK